MREIVDVQVLIISNKFDFSTDYVVRRLISKEVPYCRINTDTIQNWNLTFSFRNGPNLIAENKKLFRINPTSLKSVFFRAPSFLRSTPKDLQGQIREQWASFYKGLMMFKNALWVNYPVSTYYAENKICQLTEAHKIGFSIPDSLATNNSSKIVEKFSSHEKIICKSIDTLMFEENENEAFCYSKPISLKTIDVSSINKIPAFYQHYLSPKIDYRVTVVDNDIFAVQIINNGKGVEGDWRLLKDSVLFVEDSLPKLIKEKCISITRNLGLKFGAIDLAYHNDQFYFIEINPTGEWGWLVEAANQPIHISIVKLLCGTN